MSTSRPAPVAASRPFLNAYIQAQQSTHAKDLPTDAATVVAFGVAGVNAQGMPGAFGAYARKAVTV